MKKTIPLFTLIVTLVFEILPYGAVCNFATPEKTIRKTFSYFDLLPYGYANVAPLITAILTCVLIVLCLISFFKTINKAATKAVTVLSLITAIISLAPLLYGIHYFSVVGAIISTLLFTTFIFSLKKTN